MAIQKTTKKKTAKKVIAKKAVAKKTAPKKTTGKKIDDKSLRKFIGRKTSEDIKGKLLVVMDETSESLAALRFAGVSAKRLNSNVALLMAVETETQRHWLGVENIIKEEARQTALEKMRTLTSEITAFTNITPDIIIREGSKFAALAQRVEEDDEITAIVIGVADDDNASSIAAAPIIEKLLAGHLGLPVIIVPETLSERMLQRIARII
jgi:hypothetical protein